MIDLNHSRNLAVRPRAACFYDLLLLPVLIAGLGLIPAGRVTAQTFTVLYSFTATNGLAGTNSDGATPYAGLTVAGNSNIRYGTASLGGSAGYGTVFAINTDGTGFTNLHSFTGASDGAKPWAGLISWGNTLYGTAIQGGSWGNGTVFAMKTDGTGFTVLHSFTADDDAFDINGDGAYPNAELILLGNTLYGTASLGGSAGKGTVFALNTDGTGFTNLHSFTAITASPFSAGTNTDGAVPVAGLILSGNTLYGTASGGGDWGNGTLFALNTDGTGFKTLHSFQQTQGFCTVNNNCPPGYSCAAGICVCRGFCGGPW